MAMGAGASASTASITGSTLVAGVVGDPVRHSLSPILHNAAYQAMGLDVVYCAFPVTAGRMVEAVAGMRALGLIGLSVTMPHKADAAALADVRSADVDALGAANTLVLMPDRTISAHMTDGTGALCALRIAGFDPDGRRCLVVGAGGAGRAVVLALVRAGAREVLVVNRDRGRLRAAIALAPGAVREATVHEAADCDLIVNATPQGMGGDIALAVPETAIGPGQFVEDLVYHPLETRLLSVARDRGATPVDGLGMLIGQAGEQIRLWTGEQAPLDVMRAAALAAFSPQP